MSGLMGRVLVALLFPLAVRGAPLDFNIPAEPADEALLAFSQQAKAEVLFSYDEVHRQRSTAVAGRLEPQAAIDLLLADTGFAARPGATGGFVVTRAAAGSGGLKGRIVGSEGRGLRGARILLLPSQKVGYTDDRGEFELGGVPVGRQRAIASAAGFQALEIPGVEITAGQTLTLSPQTLIGAGEPTRLAPFVVAGQSVEARPFARGRDALPPRTATGNIDLPRTENDALPFTIHDRDKILRSGAVNLNEFLQRELLDGDASKRSPEQDANDNAPSYIASGGNLALRGYADQETVILVNGRRMPEIVASAGMATSLPDVNLIPLSLVQQIEVLPISASALYSGNPVGGVINIVLRPDADVNTTELTTTYTNTLDGYDAPQSMVSLLHSRSLLGGAMHLRLNASFTESLPPTESELGYRARRARETPPPPLWESVYRATPNLRSVDPLPEDERPLLYRPVLPPLVALGSAQVTSVAPGADGSGGIGAFAGREGVRNFSLFDAPGGMASTVASSDLAYGRQQRRTSLFASLGYDFSPRLQVGVDGTFARTTINRGYSVFPIDVRLKAASPYNPFGQDVDVSLNETAPLLGEGYSEAKIDFGAVVFGALIRLPAGWKVSGDLQYARNITRYRGFLNADDDRMQQLVDAGIYNPLRDTQVFAPPKEFYDQALVFRGRRGDFVTVGDYDTVDAAVRATNETLPLPTGRGTLNFGGDYRSNHIRKYSEQPHYGDGTPAGDEINWSARTIQRYSVFGEVQAPIVPERLRPGWLKNAEADVALRYVAAASAREDYVSPTFGLKFEFPGGLIARGSFTSSNRFPTPLLSHPIIAPKAGGGKGAPDLTTIFDPVRGELYEVAHELETTPNLITESAVTQTFGFVWQGGTVHRLRATLDYVDTRKTNELLSLDAQAAVDLEPYIHGRVFRDPAAPGDPAGAGRVNFVLEGVANLARRASQNWNTSLDYLWREAFGGSLALYGRLIYYEHYRRQLVAGSETVDELRHPRFSDFSLLRYRSNFGASWSTPKVGFGVDGHYFHSRVLPVAQWPLQGHDRIRPLWQFDVFLQGDLARWLPGRAARYGLTAQLRVNNVLDDNFPKYVGDPTGVQSYGDWRGRVLSLSLTTSF